MPPATATRLRKRNTWRAPSFCFRALRVVELFEKCLFDPRINEWLASEIVVQFPTQGIVTERLSSPVGHATLMFEMTLHPSKGVSRARYGTIKLVGVTHIDGFCPLE